jgi:inner membrane protein
MLIRTHLAIAVFVILLFVNHVNNPVAFVIVTLIATMLPDVDSAFSTLGKGQQWRALQFFVDHRGPIHSLTFTIIIAIVLSFFFPGLAFGFFLGYGTHLFVDSFTKEGIIPFWPYDKKSKGPLRTGGVLESGVFLMFLLIDVFLAIFVLL